MRKIDAIGRQRVHQLEFRAGDAGLAVGKVLNVRRAHVGDHAPVRRGYQRQGGDFAGVVHAHLDDRELVLRFEAQQLQRQAKAIVEIALGLEDVELCAQSGGNRFLGGGLSGRAGDGHHALAPLAANVRGQGLEGDERVFGDEQRRGQRGVRQGGDPRARNHRGQWRRVR